MLGGGPGLQRRRSTVSRDPPHASTNTATGEGETRPGIQGIEQEPLGARVYGQGNPGGFMARLGQKRV